MVSEHLTDYFPIRRTGRFTQSEIKKMKEYIIRKAVLSVEQDGLEVREFLTKGRGVVATKTFCRGDFVVEYRGDLIDRTIAKYRESKYNSNTEVGSYVYYFEFNGKQFCIDATQESGHLGRLVNHSVKIPNCETKLIEVDGKPVLILAARRDIVPEEEILYDYGERSKSVTEANPWLLQT